jgi:hypothetical protein
MARTWADREESTVAMDLVFVFTAISYPLITFFFFAFLLFHVFPLVEFPLLSLLHTALFPLAPII